MKLLTIGMCTYDDYDGVFFTLQALRMYHGHVMQHIELMVVDNNPGSEHSLSISRLCKNINSIPTSSPVKYIPYAGRGGTAARQKIFDEAETKFVMVIDCHVLIDQGALSRLADYLLNRYDEPDILHGPLMQDDQRVVSTHMNDQWRGGMWGTWGVAWKLNDQVFSVQEVNGKCLVVSMPDGKNEIFIDGISGTEWSGHTHRISRLGCRPLGFSADEDPFYIPGHGLGLFVCSKDTWPGFHKDAAGFGGDEMYVHKKHISNGYNVKLLPFLRWLHRFDRPNGTKYAYKRWDIVRNYCVEFLEMGWGLADVYNHFVRDTGIISDAQWEYLVADPVNRKNPPSR